MPDLLMDPKEATPYLERVRAVGAGFDKLEYGAQRRAALDLGLTTSLVSAVLRGRYLDPPTLDRLEGWVLGELAHGNDRGGRAGEGGEDHPDPAVGAGLVPGNGGRLGSPHS